MVGPTIAVDDQIRFQVGPGWLDQDMYPLARAHATGGISQHPTNSVAGRHGCDFFASLPRDVGYLLGSRIHLVQGVWAVWPHLSGVQVILARRFYAGGFIRMFD